MDILYYSNYCKHSQSVLQTLVKSNLSKKVSFICIDKRRLDPATNQMKIILENGSQVILPPNIKSVPCLSPPTSAEFCFNSVSGLGAQKGSATGGEKEPLGQEKEPFHVKKKPSVCKIEPLGCKQKPCSAIQ